MKKAEDPVVVCSRCKISYLCMPGYKNQADGCCCSLWLPSEQPETKAVPQLPEGELCAFWVSSAFEAYNNCEWNAGYGSCHDMDRFAFVNEEGQALDRESILAAYAWVKADLLLNLCDKCIDDMLLKGHLKRTWALDECYDIDEVDVDVE